MKRYTAILIVTGCVLGLLTTPDAESSVKAPSSLYSSINSACQTQASINIARAAGSTLNDCIADSFKLYAAIAQNPLNAQKVQAVCDSFNPASNQAKDALYAQQYCQLTLDVAERAEQ